MKLRVNNGEKFERTKRRYVGFSITIVGIVGLSLWKGNIIGVVVLFLILGAYFYYNIISNQIINLEANSDHLIINNKVFGRGTFKGFCLEIERKTQNLKNIVFVTEKGNFIYSIHDQEEKIKNFLEETSKHLNMIAEYNQTPLEKIARLLKL